MTSRTLVCGLIIVAVLLSVSLSLSAEQKAERIYRLSQGKIEVSAKLLKSFEGEGRPSYSFLLVVQDSHRTYEVKSDIIVVKNLDDALRILRNSIYTKDGYTFVRHECGGGNILRCNVDSVFSLHDGVLQWVGDIIGDEERGAVGHNYSTGLFKDYYDKFEDNLLTSHADAPFLEIYSRDHNGNLRADLDETWRQNYPRYLKGKETRDRILKVQTVSEQWRELLSVLLEEAIAAKYCGRTKELMEAQQIAERSFPKDIVLEFRAIVESVISGDLPTTRVRRTR
jgi:hypothetical protein